MVVPRQSPRSSRGALKTGIRLLNSRTDPLVVLPTVRVPGFDLPCFDNSRRWALASTRSSPSVPSILHVDATSQFGVFARRSTSSHQSRSPCRTSGATKRQSRSSRASATSFLSHPLPVLTGLPRGIQKSFGDTATSGRPTSLVNRAATAVLVPSTSRMHRGRLPRLSLPNACHHAVSIQILPIISVGGRGPATQSARDARARFTGDTEAASRGTALHVGRSTC